MDRADGDGQSDPGASHSLFLHLTVFVSSRTISLAQEAPKMDYVDHNEIQQHH